MVVEIGGTATGSLKVPRSLLLYCAFAEVKVRRSHGIAVKWVPDANLKAMGQQTQNLEP